MNTDTSRCCGSAGIAAKASLLLASFLFGCGASDGGVIVDSGGAPDSPAIEGAATDSGTDRSGDTGGSDASSDARADAPTEGGGPANATCVALCTTAAPMPCTFARDGVTEATGTYSISALTATGCTGTAAVNASNEKVTLTLECALGRICVYEGAEKECYPGQFDPKAFAYEIPADKKRNSCAVP